MQPARHIASAIAILVVVQVFAFIHGIGAGMLKFDDAQFNLIAGFLFGAGTTVLAFYFGSSNTAGGNRRTDSPAPNGGQQPEPPKPTQAN